MQYTGDLFEVQYYILENFFFWKSKEKTLLTLNLCMIGFLGMIPLWIIPLRYLVVAGLWLTVSMSSPFCMAIFRSLLQLGMEYGIVLERVVPTYMSELFERIDTVYIPRAQRVMRWIPIVRRYVAVPQPIQLNEAKAESSKEPEQSLRTTQYEV
jgi:hypothetical protein